MENLFAEHSSLFYGFLGGYILMVAACCALFKGAKIYEPRSYDEE